MKRLFFISLILLLSGCRLPEIRIGQAEVPAPLTVTPERLEAYRQGADYVAKTIESPVETVYVADELSSSLGAPKRPLDNVEDVVESLRKAYKDQEEEIESLNRKLERLQGKDIEGTGVDILPFGGGIGFIALIAAIILVPGFGTFVFWIIRKAFTNTRGAFKSTIRAIEDFKKEKPSEASALLNYLSKHQDSIHKDIVRRLQK